MTSHRKLWCGCKSPGACLLILLLGLFTSPVMGEISYHQQEHVWSLTSGPVEYRLIQKDDAVFLAYFGPRLFNATNQSTAPPTWEIKEMDGQIEGQSLTPDNLILTRHQMISQAANIDELVLKFRHRRLPLDVEIRYATWGKTGVLTRRLALHNRGSQVLRVETIPSLSWELPAGPYSLTYLWGSWGQERQVATEQIGAAQLSLGSRTGRSTSSCAAWFSLRNENSGIRYFGQLAYSGNWQMKFERQLGEVPNVVAQMGIRFDFDGSMALPPGATFDAPMAAFTATVGDLDEGANQLHRYQRQFVAPPRAVHQPPLVQYNNYFPYQAKFSAADMKRCVDAVVDLGVEVFVIDAGWNGQKDWMKELGDWRPNPIAFPKGTAELADYVHAKGMKFGMWVMIEALGEETEVFKKHPDWCLNYNGQPIVHYGHGQLDFGKSLVRQCVVEAIDRIVLENKLDWLKIDGDDLGNRFDPSGSDRPGDILHRHIAGYYLLLEEIRHKHPNLVVENCASGGGRFDLGMLACTHTAWISDVVETTPSLQLAYGATLEFIPEVCNHWMVGGQEGQVDPSTSSTWFQFMLRVPMTGHFGISSRVLDWPAHLQALAIREVQLYKRLRSILAFSDVYHLTPPPAHQSPTGWMALQYVADEGKHSVLFAYRLAQGSAQQTFKLRGLRAEEQYRIMQDGQYKAQSSGESLTRLGLTMDVPNEWQAVIVELEVVP